MFELFCFFVPISNFLTRNLENQKDNKNILVVIFFLVDALRILFFLFPWYFFYNGIKCQKNCNILAILAFLIFSIFF